MIYVESRISRARTGVFVRVLVNIGKSEVGVIVRVKGRRRKRAGQLAVRRARYSIVLLFYLKVSYLVK